MPDLLIELFSEEIPARMQVRARADFKKLMTDGLVDAGLTYSDAMAFATPRRLALSINGLPDQSPCIREERKGPRVDAPEQAIEGFLRSTGLSKSDLIVRDDKKGQVYVAIIETSGRAAAEIVAEVLERTIRNFPWPKSMRWGSGSLKWVRPLHSILCILSNDVESEIVPLNLDGISSGDITFGHRFLAPAEISVSGFEDYAAKLKKAFVVLDPAERADVIRQDAENQAFANGGELIQDDGLLAEVAGLVEWPVVLLGNIHESFWDLPPEVLKTSMKEHQKFFSVRNPKTGRIEKFITVANRETKDNGATILVGNQKVLFARLSDAKFFWENDLRTVRAEGMASWRKKLADVTFHNKLGSEGDRIDRIAALSKELAAISGAIPDLAEQAAQTVKADLASEMVYEFPDLQGLMGRYYSEAAGLAPEIAAACEDHYAPLGPSDSVPTAPVSVTVALADKLDKLTSFWAIDEKPTGSKDPFALRRAALGVIRLVLENDLRMPLLDAFEKAYPGADKDNLLSFFHDRLKVYLRDQNIRHDVIDAAIAKEGRDDLTLVTKRARALGVFLDSEDGENLLQGFKRANNILTQAEDQDGVEYSFGADEKLAQTDEETQLFAALKSETPQIRTALGQDNFQLAMVHLSKLRAPVDGFFEAVQVNTDNAIVRRNRLNLLSEIRTICLSVADLSRIEGA